MATRIIWADVDDDGRVLEPEEPAMSLWSFAVTVAIVTLGCWSFFQFGW